MGKINKAFGIENKTIYQRLMSSLKDKTGLNIIIKNKKNNTGSISFEYKDLDQLNRIVDVIKSSY